MTYPGGRYPGVDGKGIEGRLDLIEAEKDSMYGEEFAVVRIQITADDGSVWISSAPDELELL